MIYEGEDFSGWNHTEDWGYQNTIIKRTNGSG